MAMRRRKRRRTSLTPTSHGARLGMRMSRPT